jgi:hypothetical protein
MGKLFGILLIVFAIWVGMSIYTEGTDRAFGGILTRFAPAPAEGEVRDTRPSLERIRTKVQSARHEQLDRIERQLRQEAYEER